MSDGPAEGRPVLAREQVQALTKRVLGFTTLKNADVSVSHTALVVTRMANDQVLSGDDGDELWITFGCSDGRGYSTGVATNQLDDTVLRAIVHQAESILSVGISPAESLNPEEHPVPDALVPVQLWHGDVAEAMRTTRDSTIQDMMRVVLDAGLQAAGFVGLMARAQSVLNKEGMEAYHEETDCEVTMTARSKDGTSSGWGGGAARQWSRINPTEIAERAVYFAKLGMNPVAMEPGRRTAILGPAAVAQLMRFFHQQTDAFDTDNGQTGFSKMPQGNRLGQRVFDPRITISSNPADPDGGYCPYFGAGFGTPAMTWVENGILKNLSYSMSYALQRGKPYSEAPLSFRIAGGPTSVDEMIANCREGIYVNRISSTQAVSQRNGLVTGVTRDGCFYVKDGKIVRPVKNFRVLESPFFFLNRLEAIGPTGRAAFGYTPPNSRYGGGQDWPLRPVIVPPMMVRDFNFNATSTAV